MIYSSDSSWHNQSGWKDSAFPQNQSDCRICCSSYAYVVIIYTIIMNNV